jgi:hypothetical protein
MKNKILVGIMLVMLCYVLVGCEDKPIGNNSSSNENSNTNNVNNNTNTSNDNTKTNKDALSIIEVPGLYTNDLPLGLENRYVIVNGQEVVIRLQTSGSSKQQANGPYYIKYNVYVGNDAIGFNCVRDAIYHLEGYGVQMLKEFDEEEDAGVNHEFFEWDFTSTALKGSDKDYVAISLPAGIEDKNQASLLITTDDGKLLGEFIADVVHGTTLSGTEADKYKNHSGDYVFNSIKDGKVTYLTPTAAMYKDKVLDSSLEEIELEEHQITISNNKVTDTKTNNTYKITNAKGKTFKFSEFRHL